MHDRVVMRHMTGNRTMPHTIEIENYCSESASSGKVVYDFEKIGGRAE